MLPSLRSEICSMYIILSHCSILATWWLSHSDVNYAVNTDISWMYESFFHSPTDAQANCLKNNFKILKFYIKIYIKTAPTCFGAVTPSSGSALYELAKVTVVKIVNQNISVCGNVAVYISGSLLVCVRCTVRKCNVHMPTPRSRLYFWTVHRTHANTKK